MSEEGPNTIHNCEELVQMIREKQPKLNFHHDVVSETIELIVTASDGKEYRVPLLLDPSLLDLKPKKDEEKNENVENEKCKLPNDVE